MKEQASPKQWIATRGKTVKWGGGNHQELADYVTSHSISWIWRSKRMYRNTFKTKETVKCIWNRHIYFIKNHDKWWSHLLSIQRAWYSRDSSNQLQLSCLSVRNRIGNILLLISNSATNIPSRKSSMKGQTPFGNATRLLPCTLPFCTESFLMLDGVTRAI